MAGGISTITDQNGVATIMVNPGTLDVSVSHEGFIAGKTSVTVAVGQTQEVVLESHSRTRDHRLSNAYGYAARRCTSPSRGYPAGRH